MNVTWVRADAGVFFWIIIGNSWNSSERSGRREPPVHRHLDRERAEDGDQRVRRSGGVQTPLRIC